MAEHRLIAAMEEEVAAKIAEIERQTEERLREVEVQAERTVAETQAAADARVAAQLRQDDREQRARLENERRLRLRNLQFELAAGVFAELEQAAALARQRADYPAVWRRLWDEAIAAFRRERTETPIVVVAPEDRRLAADVAAAGIEERGTIAGGVELLSPDRRLRVCNTLASRLNRGREEFLKMLADAMEERMKR